MALGRPDRVVGLPHRHNYRETKPLKLGATHVPFPCSLFELVLDRYAEPPGVGGNEHPMQLDELLAYLKNIDNFNLSPWVVIAGQTEAIGDPATPSREQIAIMRWLGKAQEIWERQFPLEGRLAAQLRRLKPLSAALAITDPSFMRPGAHPIHQLLDSIQARAIGWQLRLDRVGTILEQQVTRAVEQSSGWFDDHASDLAGICAEFSAAAERDQARTQRMVQRVVETEAGKVKTAAAKQAGARMINAMLEKYPAPEEIGEFLKGPWYTSAQLILLKFGAESEHWEKMCATTETLLDSLQTTEEAQETRRQYIFEVVTQLPKEMRRWLLSLHHDTEAVNEAMGLVERAHLRILRRQPLELQRIQPIQIEDGNNSDGTGQSLNALKSWQEGQWFSVNSDEGILRVQLVLKEEQSQQLVFTNMAGIKVLQLTFAQFGAMLEQDKVKALYSGASFSLCLAYAVGIDSVEILDALVSALSDIEPSSSVSNTAQPQAGPAPTLQAKLKLAPTAEEPELALEPAGDLAPEPETKPELDLAPESTLQPVPVEAMSAQAEPEPPAADQSATESSHEAPKDSPKTKKQRSASKKAVDGGGFLSEQAQDIKARGGYVIPQAATAPGAKPPTDQEQNSNTGEGYLSEQAADNATKRDPPNEPTPAERTEPEQLDESAPVPQRAISLPMGAWLGFHDGETPLMARLAVHDPEEGYYIFVNRNGVKMRQVSSQELLRLVDSGLVDILEANSNFRNEVTEVRKNLDQ